MVLSRCQYFVQPALPLLFGNDLRTHALRFHFRNQVGPVAFFCQFRASVENGFLVVGIFVFQVGAIGLHHIDSVSEIYAQVSISTISYFSKIFRDEYACTPSEYRQKAMADSSF